MAAKSAALMMAWESSFNMAMRSPGSFAARLRPAHAVAVERGGTTGDTP